MIRWTRSAALGIAITVLGAGCVRPPARVVEGKSYAIGNPSFDSFFEDVLTARSDGLGAENEARAARALLIKALGLEEGASAQLVASEAGERAKRLKGRGISMHLELVPSVALAVSIDRAALDPDSRDFVLAIEAAAKGAIDLEKRLAGLAGRAAALEKVRATLRADAPITFRGEPQARRDEIVDELDAAAGVIATAGDAGGRQAGQAARFVLELARAVETGAGEGAASAPAKVPAKGAAKPSAAPAKKPAQAGVAPAPPKKKPKASDDFDP